MNDEFLAALRRDPPPRFASELKRRLDRQARLRSRSSTVRSVVGVLLIGGVAVAAALLLRERSEPLPEAAPVARALPSPFSGAAQPTRSSHHAPRLVRGSGVAPPPPEATEVPSGDIPVWIIASPFSRPLAEALVGRLPKYGYFAQPRVLNMDDEEALRALCGNTDFAMVSRRVSAQELALCRKWGIDIDEWKLGYQAVVLSARSSARPLALTPREVFLALAERIPDPAHPGQLIDNPNSTWHDVDKRFGEGSIDVVLADFTAKLSFLQLVMEPGCETYPWIRELKTTDRRRYEDICHRLRGNDDQYREMSLTFLEMKLRRDPECLVILGYALYAKSRELLPRTALDGPAPTPASLANGTYPAARPVYVYAQREHLNWNHAARRIADELTSQEAVGPEGYLLRLGLVPKEHRK
jgi:phosphate transport system substrate-binding protein